MLQVAVNATGDPELFTVDAKSGWADVSYEFGDNDEPAQPEKKKPVKAEKSVITSRVRQLKEDFQLDDDARKRHQADLEKKLQEDASKRYAAGNAAKKDEAKGKSIVAYKASTDYPDLAVRKNCVQVDSRNECVLIPINGVVIPFHISLVKNVTKSGGEDGQLTFLRLIFNTPGSVNIKETIAKTVHTNANYSFISEVSFKSRNKQNIEQNLRLIKELQKRIKDREKKKEEESQAYKQEALIISRRGVVPRLPELQMRPVASGRKSSGTLECHDNGFRFSTH